MEPNNRKLYSGHNNFEFHAYSLYFMRLRYDKEIIKDLTTIKRWQILLNFVLFNYVFITFLFKRNFIRFRMMMAITHLFLFSIQQR